ncbi:hypothetical protein C2G38_2169048 [Gigaspora rosea]|uniref:DNA 3'-5' helicase n=1 Tax=Gigaspora rosea TaxID=44941 RepID=A0A397VP48_9GLOM|nr:hypothetical protein C2G38_2169048 [Gigaspora rosea]
MQLLVKYLDLINLDQNNKDSINCFIEENNTLYILPMGEGKSLVYAASALLFTGLTVAFTPLKALIEDQIQNFPSSLILLLTATCSKDNVQKITDSLGLSDLKIFQNPTIYRSEIRFEVLNKPVQKEKQPKILIDLISSVFLDQCIVYSATINDCDTFNNIVVKQYGSNIIGKYHRSMPSKDKIIHTTFPMSINVLVQEAGRAGQNGAIAKNIIMYSSLDIRTLLLIVSQGCPSNEETYPEDNHSVDVIQQYEYLQKKQGLIFEIVTYCESVYEYCQQQAYQSFL